MILECFNQSSQAHGWLNCKCCIQQPKLLFKIYILTKLSAS